VALLYLPFQVKIFTLISFVCFSLISQISGVRIDHRRQVLVFRTEQTDSEDARVQLSELAARFRTIDAKIQPLLHPDRTSLTAYLVPKP
jgi:hypothetical protein